MLILGLSSCTKTVFPDPPCPDGNTGISYSADLQPFFDANCTICHPSSSPPDLGQAWSYEELTTGADANGLLYVDTEFPCSSKLYMYVSGKHNGSYTEEEILNILGWIQDEAPEN